MGWDEEDRGCFEDGLDWAASICVGGAPRVGATSKVAGKRERGSCGGTVATLTEAMSLQKKCLKKKCKGQLKNVLFNMGLE
jgi:hypothetical protein